jgi:hypothetical protein
MAYGIFDNIYSELRGTDDYQNHLAAAFTAGYLFKCTAGIRPALISGSLLSSVVLGFWGYEFYTKRAI